MILITGVAGFIGSNVCLELLKMGEQVIGIDNFDTFYAKELKDSNIKKLLKYPNFSFIKLDITNYFYLKDKLKDKRIDCVVHLAAKAGVPESIHDSESYLLNNVHGTKNILELMKLINIRNIIFASSSSVYGLNTPPFVENYDTSYPLTPYATTKKTCELLTYNYHYLFNFNIINLRFFNVYGSAMRPQAVIHKFCKEIMIEKKQIIVHGDGNSSRDYTHISDINKGIISAIDYLKKHENIYEIINLGNGNPINIKNLVTLLFQKLNLEESFSIGKERNGDIKHTFANIDKARRMLNYSPTVIIEDGIPLFLDWFYQYYGI